MIFSRVRIKIKIEIIKCECKREVKQTADLDHFQRCKNKKNISYHDHDNQRRSNKTGFQRKQTKTKKQLQQEELKKITISIRVWGLKKKIHNCKAFNSFLSVCYELYLQQQRNHLPTTKKKNRTHYNRTEQ